MSTKFLAGIAVAVAVATAPLAKADTSNTLANLANGGSLSVGDKTFSGFSYNESGLTGFNPANIVVLATQIGNVDYLTWEGNISLASITPADADLLLNYTVQASAGVINEIDQQYTGGGNGVYEVSVAETVDYQGNQVASSYLTTGQTSTPPFTLGSGQPYIIPGEADLQVTKDINLALLSAGQVSISSVAQSFHQSTIPDGGMTLILLGGAMTAMTLVRSKVGKLK